MPTPNTLTVGDFTQHRVVAGAPIAADPTDLTLIDRKAILHTSGCLSIKGYVRLVGAGATMDLIPLIYDRATNTFGALTKISGLLDGQIFQIDVHECPVYFRIDAVANAPTAAEIRLASAELTANA